MIKQGVRVAIDTARQWLNGTAGEPEVKLGPPPFSYQDANLFFKRLAIERRIDRPQYLWGALQAVNLGKTLGLPRVSLIEFGVAGGNGLVALENIAADLADVFKIEIEVHGFDVGEGLPEAKDYRDLPNMWRPGSYRMDREKLLRRLKKARLHLGLVENTVKQFIASNPAPVAFISFDLDYYSSTVQAFALFRAQQRVLLPRIHCYFDDIMGKSFSDFTGERLAIAEFNQGNSLRKISPIYGLKYYLPDPYKNHVWSEMMFMVHIFDHDLYKSYDGLIPQRDLDLRDEQSC